MKRTEVLRLVASAGVWISATGSCVHRPAQTEGPYFVEERLNRSDIRAKKPGTPLVLTFAVSERAGAACKPLSGARVDVWHCDAQGIYSDVRDPLFATIGQTFLRGYQVTDSAGHAHFTTIYPGWYEGRAVHVHFKIRKPGSAAVDFTSQIYFDDALTDRVHRAAAYAKPGRRTRNGDDGIYQGGGAQLLLAAAASGDGYAGTFDIALEA